MIAIASELAGLFYLSLNASITANAHLCTAYHTYMVTLFIFFASRSCRSSFFFAQEWGAIVKVKALVARLPFVDFGAARTHQASSSPSITNSVHAQMDVESVVKASRVLTTELRCRLPLPMCCNG